MSVIKGVAVIANSLGVFIALALFLFAVGIGRSMSTGPPPGATGIPAKGELMAEITCVSCHDSFPLNPDDKGKILLMGVPEHYDPGRTYVLRFNISHPEAIRWGFELTAVDANTFRGAGDFKSVANSMTQRIPGGTEGRVYIAHGTGGKIATGIGQKGSYSWQFNWVAPSEDVGQILFFGCGNAANADGSPAGDSIYCSAPEALGSTRSMK